MGDPTDPPESYDSGMFFQGLVENASEGIITVDSNGEIVYSNPAVADILGYAVEDIVGKNITTLIPERLVDDHLQAFETYLRTGEPSFEWDEIEFPAVHQDGHEVEVEITYYEHEYEGKRVFTGFLTDITARTERENRIRQERKRFKALFDRFPEPAISVLIDDGDTVIREVNPAFEAVFAYDEEEVIGKPINDLIVPEDGQAEAEEIDQLTHEGEFIEREVIRSTRDGQRHFLFRNIPIPGEADVAMYGVYVDISEQKHREEAVTALHDAALQFGKADTKSEVFEILVSTAEEILDFALVAVDVREGEALVQKTWSLEQDNEGYYDYTPLEEDTLATRSYKRGETIVADDLREYDITPADPEYLSALTVPIGEIGTFQTVAREVGGFDTLDRELAELLVNHAREAVQRLDHAESLEQQRERLHRENDRLETMVGFISHDLRNPLNVAEGNIELALEKGETSHLERSMDALERMETLIDDVLTWAKEGAHVSAEETSTLYLREMAEACWQNVETGEATLRIEGDPTIIADKGRLQQVFENLYRNAVEHGGTDVEIRMGEYEDGVYFEDDGPGIPPEERQKVFEYGYSSSDGGSGFGLNIVKEIVKAHGWEISVTEGSTGGARFEITGVEFDY